MGGLLLAKPLLLAVRLLHDNKLLSMNSLLLAIFNNLHIMYSKVQILAFYHESAYVHTSLQARTAQRK